MRTRHGRRNGAWLGVPWMELPLPAWQLEHVEGCQVCREHWDLNATALHEACHTAVALDLGIKVEFVAIDRERTVEATKLEATLYPIIAEGFPIPAMITRLDPDSLRDTPKKVLTAMAAPSTVVTGHPEIDAYAGIESMLVVHQARIRDIDPDEILDWARREVERCQEHIQVLARRLCDEGWVDLEG